MKPLPLSTADSLRHIQKPPMLIEEILPMQSISLIVGPTYSGKTFFALEAARAVAFSTGPFMGRWKIDNPGNVLFIEQDSPEWDTGRALWALLKKDAAYLDMQPDGGKYMDALQTSWHPGMDLKNQEDCNRIAFTAQKLDTFLGFNGPHELHWKGTKLIIMDTFRSMHTAEENSSTEMQPIMKRLQQIRDLTDAAIMLIHHTSKGEMIKPRGSTAIEGAVDNIFQITANKKQGVSKVVITKARAIQPPNFDYKIITTEDEEYGLIKQVLVADAAEAQIKETRPTHQKLLAGIASPRATLNTRQLAEAWGEKRGVTKDKIHRWLRLLERQEHIKREGERIIHLTPVEKTGTLPITQKETENG